MRPLPHLGVPSEPGLEWHCGYSGPTPAAGELQCLTDATWHGYVLDDDGTAIVAMMSSCDRHLGFMELTADYVHPLVHPCCVPGAWFRWPENECYLDWDDRELLASESAPAGVTR